jgi:chlorobactene glucosyltransferase
VKRSGVLRWRKALLWSYVTGVAAFYAALAWRTRGGGERPVMEQPECASVGAANGWETEDWPKVSIVVPARNEERNIRECVTSLLAQDYPNFSLIVVDDASEDATADILLDMQHTHPNGARLEVLRVERLPEGWAGKPHALHTGAVMADGDWLLFTDADTRHEPGALRLAVARALADGDDLLSLGATQELPDFWGRVLMPLAYMGIAMQYPPRQVNDPNSSVAIANGQYMLIRRAMYRRIGGYAHPALRATVLDDRDLASVVKRAGGRLELVDGRTLVRTRMYHGLREHWEGWSKNAYAGSRGGGLFYLLMIAGLPLVCVVPFVLPLVGLLARRPRVALAGSVAAGAVVAYRAQLNQELGVPFRYVWTHPLGALVFTGILARSFWRVRSGRGVRWRGRTYQTVSRRAAVEPEHVTTPMPHAPTDSPQASGAQPPRL